MAKNEMIPVMAIILTIVTIMLGSTIGLAMIGKGDTVFQSLVPGNQYTAYTESIVGINPAVSNVSTLTYGRVTNSSITVTLNQTESNGLTTLVQNTHFVLTSYGTLTAGGQLTFSTLNKTKLYTATVVYEYYRDVGALNGNAAWNNTASTIFSSWPLLALVVLALIGSAVLFSIMVFR